jgi:2,3-bisphosphoglycerate-dependent phosphoglycerate mutase
MDKKLFIIRHCKAEGQPAEADLTKDGYIQANNLAEFFADAKIDRVLSSPFLRALETVKPFAKKQNLEVEVDTRLSERILAAADLTDWMERLKETFDDLDLCLEGGESSHQAMARAVSVVDEILKSDADTAIIVTHGNLMALLLKYFQNDYGFEEWRRLTNPDVYSIHFKDNEITIERKWRESH